MKDCYQNRKNTLYPKTKQKKSPVKAGLLYCRVNNLFYFV